MWGTDALFRKPLARVDLGGDDRLRRARDPRADHAAAARAGDARAASARGRATSSPGSPSAPGASAIATILFTQAFVHGDPITPVVLQKVQPLIAIAAARVILGEEPRRRFAWFVIPALLGVWLIAFPQPFDVHAPGVQPIALALGAAVLWGLGTVFGRYLARRLRVRPHRDGALLVRARRERDRAADPRRAGVRERARHALDRVPRARHGTRSRCRSTTSACSGRRRWSPRSRSSRIR